MVQLIVGFRQVNLYIIPVRKHLLKRIFGLSGCMFSMEEGGRFGYGEEYYR